MIEIIGPQTILEMTLFAEYLMARGVLVSELNDLSGAITASYRMEATHYAARKLDQICHERQYPWYEEIKISLN